MAITTDLAPIDLFPFPYNDLCIIAKHQLHHTLFYYITVYRNHFILKEVIISHSLINHCHSFCIYINHYKIHAIFKTSPQQLDLTSGPFIIVLWLTRNHLKCLLQAPRITVLNGLTRTG